MERLGAEQTHNFCLCTDRRVTTSTAATSGSASSPREESVLAGFELTPTAPLDDQRRWRIAAAPLGCDGALAEEVGA